MNPLIRSLFATFFAVTLAACSGLGGDTKPDEGEGAEVVDHSTSGGDAQTHGLGGGGQFTAEDLNDPASPLATRVIYFDFDMSTIRSEFNEVLRAHASYLQSNPGARLVLEGHADERGSREYNIALGERRAESVAQFLLLHGAGGNQIETVSFGEENPAALGHDEAAWSLNRRVELVYPL